jgi:hypothetical protein
MKNHNSLKLIELDQFEKQQIVSGWAFGENLFGYSAFCFNRHYAPQFIRRHQNAIKPSVPARFFVEEIVTGQQQKLESDFV